MILLQIFKIMHETKVIYMMNFTKCLPFEEARKQFPLDILDKPLRCCIESNAVMLSLCLDQIGLRVYRWRRIRNLFFNCLMRSLRSST